jgi:SAM-dependent methyltransferase
MQIRGVSYQQRDDLHVSRFWDSTAVWRATYFDDLLTKPAASMARGIVKEREFVAVENRILDILCSRQVEALELGCGIGRQLLSLAKKSFHSRFVGIDFSPLQIEQFNERVEKENIRNAQAVLSNVDTVSLPDHSRDLIFATNQTIGNFLGDRRRTVFAEIKRLLKPAGQLYIGGFDLVGHAAECFGEWGVQLRDIDLSSGFVQTEHYNTLWQPQSDLVAELFESGYLVTYAERAGLGYCLIGVHRH